MKIRNGFVSNSSSSSFLIYGIQATCPEDEEVYDFTERAEKAGLNSYIVDSEPYLGLEWDQVQDDETGAQFKERVKKMLTDFFGEEPEKIGTLSEAWYDG